MHKLPQKNGPSKLKSPRNYNFVKRAYIGIIGKNMEATVLFWGYMRIMETKMEATILFWGYVGIMDKQIVTLN